MTHIDQSRPFDQRLNGFGPELGPFLGQVWRRRTTINLRDFEAGTAAIYALYSGRAMGERRYNLKELQSFIRRLRSAVGQYSVHLQALERPLSTLTDTDIEVYGQDLWGDFFHVLVSPNPTQDVRSRVYAHAADANASIQLMTLIIQQFDINVGVWEAKTAGPGAQRHFDTIVSYHYDAASADALVGILQTAQPNLFIDSLPPLVKRVAPGIGVADEPPAIELYRSGGTRHSFGSFFSTLCWVALKATPNVASPNADGRHMLDNMLYSLRTLGVDPRNPQRFPAAAQLEAWYRASVR